ncbi:MAG: ComEC/Rec2 family competence protein [Candidatus Dependentiae bacterium]|nr:ComEC/Rec2 family competence protein [Candidatus Dependentiae bacterium]
MVPPVQLPHSLIRLLKSLSPLPLHPLYLFTGALALGIAWQASNLTFTIPLAAGLILFLLFSPRLRGQKYILTIVSTSTIFLLGALRHQERVSNFNAFHRLIGHRPVRIVSQVVDCEPDYRKPGNFIATLSIQMAQSSPSTGETGGPSRARVHQFDSKIVTDQRLVVHIGTTDGKPPPFEVGDTVALERIFFRSPPDGGEYGQYLIKEGLIAHAHSKSEEFMVITHPDWSLNRTIANLRNRTIAALRDRLTPQTFSLFTSIFWGKHALDREESTEIREAFRPWGVLHYLARSGLHLTLLIALLERMISLFPIPFMVRTLLGAALVGAYALISWSSISFTRAILVFFLFVIATLLWIPSQGIYRLSLVCFIILLLNPLQLFFLDFQLSFLVTAILMWLSMLSKAENS